MAKSLEDRPESAIEQGDLGEFDGDEFGPGIVTLYMYGADAEKLFAGIHTILEDDPFAKGARS